MLWKVDINPKKKLDLPPDVEELVDPLTRLSKVFTVRPDDGHLHIFVECHRIVIMWREGLNVNGVRWPHVHFPERVPSWVKQSTKFPNIDQGQSLQATRGSDISRTSKVPDSAFFFVHEDMDEAKLHEVLDNYVLSRIKYKAMKTIQDLQVQAALDAERIAGLKVTIEIMKDAQRKKGRRMDDTIKLALFYINRIKHHLDDEEVRTFRFYHDNINGPQPDPAILFRSWLSDKEYEPVTNEAIQNECHILEDYMCLITERITLMQKLRRQIKNERPAIWEDLHHVSIRMKV
ncbi:uncharacterized protein HD556DRAFT_1314335 [Suillus plorans]|uniref:Uncharacterized protein n=1 Tax=Suillus plorans TaxID=116603 RepID=A0A9P7AA92_9AGAM|nr:uncharacterized protein HD556DRAFT_1314335 [Suillus plorans]KAG1785302.1 hypothetical protein HD556DRAFT_1314335 [Suillus plorans]